MARKCPQSLSPMTQSYIERIMMANSYTIRKKFSTVCLLDLTKYQGIGVPITENYIKIRSITNFVENFGQDSQISLLSQRYGVA